MEPHVEEDREDQLPEHETRDEGATGGGLTSSAITAPQAGAGDEALLEGDIDDEPQIDPNEPPPAYRPRSG